MGNNHAISPFGSLPIAEAAARRPTFAHCGGRRQAADYCPLRRAPKATDLCQLLRPQGARPTESNSRC